MELAHRAITTDYELKQRDITIAEDEALLRFAGGDARKLLNIIDLMCQTDASEKVVITNESVVEGLQQNQWLTTKTARCTTILFPHLLSRCAAAPDAAIYWLARMVVGGEDPKFIARRLVILASEDIGLANPNALLLANACFDALQKIGWPEGRIILAETTIYLATSPKSNSAYLSIDEAIAKVKETGNLPVPLHLRNAPTKLMKELNYGKEYKYAHDFENHFVEQQYLPSELKHEKFWKPQDNPAEKKLDEYLKRLKDKIYRNQKADSAKQQIGFSFKINTNLYSKLMA